MSHEQPTNYEIFDALVDEYLLGNVTIAEVEESYIALTGLIEPVTRTGQTPRL